MMRFPPKSLGEMEGKIRFAPPLRCRGKYLARSNSPTVDHLCTRGGSTARSAWQDSIRENQVVIPRSPARLLAREGLPVVTSVVVGSLNTDIVGMGLTRFPNPGEHVYGQELLIGPGG